MVVDVHTHFFPDRLARKTIGELEGRTDHAITAVSTGTLDSLLADMIRQRIDFAVTCPIATKPNQFETILRSALAIRDGEHGREAARRIIPFASIHPVDEARFIHLQTIAESGVRGIKLHPYYQPCVIDSPAMLEFFRCCRDLRLVVQCHCGFDIGFPRENICGPERVAHVMREVSGLRLIAAHLGGWRQWECVAEHLVGTDVFLDTSILPPDHSDDKAINVLRNHPPEKLLYATDWPWLSFQQGLEYLDKGGFTTAQLEAVKGGNAAQLLGIRR